MREIIRKLEDRARVCRLPRGSPKEKKEPMKERNFVYLKRPWKFKKCTEFKTILLKNINLRMS